MKTYALLVASLSLLVACGDASSFGSEPEGAESSSSGSAPDTAQEDTVGTAHAALQNGTATTTLFPEVMQILTSIGGQYYTCTATAIAEDMLVTASHCIKSGTTVADWVKVYNADGDNNSAEGSYSSYFAMSKYNYSTWSVGSSMTSTEASRDMVFVKFGKKTFNKYLSFSYKTDLATVGTTITMIGFGAQSVKSYGTRTIASTSTTTSTTGYGYFTVKSDTTSQPYTEHGDSGGPLLLQQDGQYYVVGMLTGASTSGTTAQQVYPALTKGVFDHVSTFLTAREKYCAEAYTNSYSSAWGGSWSFCLPDSINSLLDAQGFSDPFNVYARGNDSSWNDQISAFTLPQGMSGTFYENGGQSGGSLTLVNAFPFLNNNVVGDLQYAGFNDKISSWKLTYSASPSVWIKSDKSNLCVDVNSGNKSAGVEMIQWNCQSGNINQQWQLVPTSTANVYQVKSNLSGLCLDVVNGSTSNGAYVQQWYCDSNNPAQRFRFEQFPGPNKFRMVNAASGKCVDNTGSTNTLSKLWMWDCLAPSNPSVPNQIFSFQML